MQWTCWLTLAYMIHDTMHMLMTWKFTKNKLMLLHHISFTIISNSGGRILGDPASLLTFEVDDCIIITLIFSFMESSTIFLNTRWLIAIVLCKGQPKSKFLKLFLTVNEFLFLGCFVFFRYAPIYSCYRSIFSLLPEISYFVFLLLCSYSFILLLTTLLPVTS